MIISLVVELPLDKTVSMVSASVTVDLYLKEPVVLSQYKTFPSSPAVGVVTLFNDCNVDACIRASVLAILKYKLVVPSLI